MSVLSGVGQDRSNNALLYGATEMHLSCPTPGVSSAQSAMYDDMDSLFMYSDGMDICALQENSCSGSGFDVPLASESPLGLEHVNEEKQRWSDNIWSRSPRGGVPEDFNVASGVSFADLMDSSETSLSDDTCVTVHMADALHRPSASSSVNSARQPPENQHSSPGHLSTDASVRRTPDPVATVAREAKRAAVFVVGADVVQYCPARICCDGKPCIDEKQSLRMHKNRESAQKSRLIKAEKSKALERELVQFKLECAALREENCALKAANKLLRAGARESGLQTDTTPSPSSPC